jgi:hypothetical protein
LGNSSIPKVFTISNIGNVVLNIETIVLKGIDTSGFNIQNDYCSARSLFPSDACTFEVVFTHLPSGSKTAQIEITSSDPNNPPASIIVTSWLKGDIDDNGRVDLADAIAAMQILSRITPAQAINAYADVNGDGKIGLPEVIYILQTVAGMR